MRGVSTIGRGIERGTSAPRSAVRGARPERSSALAMSLRTRFASRAMLLALSASGAATLQGCLADRFTDAQIYEKINKACADKDGTYNFELDRCVVGLGDIAGSGDGSGNDGAGVDIGGEDAVGGDSLNPETIGQNDSDAIDGGDDAKDGSDAGDAGDANDADDTNDAEDSADGEDANEIGPVLDINIGTDETTVPDVGEDADDAVDGASDAGEDVGPDGTVEDTYDTGIDDLGLDGAVDGVSDNGATDAGADDVGPADIAGDVTIADGFIDSDGDGVLDSSGIDGGVDGSTDSGDAGGDTPDVPVPPTCDGEPLGTINQPYPYDPKTLGKGVCVSGLDICGLEKSTGKAIGNRFSLRSAQLQKHAMVKTTIVTG